jgi:hypothetical protein
MRGGPQEAARGDGEDGADEEYRRAYGLHCAE